MTTWAHEQMYKEHCARESERRRLNPDTGLYAEYNGKEVELVLSNGNTVSGHFNKAYKEDSYRVVVLKFQDIKFKAADIKSIKLRDIQ